MERNTDPDRTLDSVEQMDAGEPANPITAEVSELSEPGKGLNPGAPDADATEEDEGPPARTTQMPR